MTSPNETWEDMNRETPNHMIIWLDQSIGNPTEYIHLKKAFATNTDPRFQTWTMMKDADYDKLLAAGEAVTVHFEGVSFLLQAFTDEDACLRAFKKNEDKRIFFITSGTKGRNIVPRLMARHQHKFTDPIKNEPYSSIYVFCHTIELQMDWAINYYQYLQMFTFDQDLLERLTRDICEYFLERGERIREDGDLNGSLQRFHWAKKLRNQYDKMQQNIGTDDHREVTLTGEMRQINASIAQIEELIKTEKEAEHQRRRENSSDDEHSTSDEEGHQPS